MSSDDELKNYFAGVGIALCSTACSAVGLTCQKLTHKRMLAQKDAGVKAKKYYLQPLWLTGIVAMLVGALLSFAVFNFLGQSRASAMASITIVWNGILAAVFLGERFTIWDGIVTFIIISGASIAVAFGSVGSASQSNSDLASIVQTLSRELVWISAIIITTVWVAVYLLVRRLSAKGSGRSFTEVRTEVYMRIFLSGIMTGVTGMLASSVVKSIGGSVRSDNPGEVLAAYQFYLLLFTLPISLVLQLGFLNSALAQLDALEVVPPFQASVIIIGLLWGWLFTGDASGATQLSTGMFACGCGISCIGVALLGLKKKMVARTDAFFSRQCRTPYKHTPSGEVIVSATTTDATVTLEGLETSPTAVDSAAVLQVTIKDEASTSSGGAKSPLRQVCPTAVVVVGPVLHDLPLPGASHPRSSEIPQLLPAETVHRTQSERAPRVARASSFLNGLFLMPSVDTHEDDKATMHVVDNVNGATRERFVGVNDSEEPSLKRSSSAFLPMPEEKSSPPVRMQRRGTIDNHDELLGTDTALLDSSFTLVSSLGHMLSDGLSSRASKTSASPNINGRAPAFGGSDSAQLPLPPSQASIAPAPV